LASSYENWIVDLKANLVDSSSREDTDGYIQSRIADLESLVLSIGVQIVSHFTDNRQMHAADMSVMSGEEVNAGGS
jgi:hypothetical protein